MLESVRLSKHVGEVGKYQLQRNHAELETDTVFLHPCSVPVECKQYVVNETVCVF